MLRSRVLRTIVGALPSSESFWPNAQSDVLKAWILTLACLLAYHSRALQQVWCREPAVPVKAGRHRRSLCRNRRFGLAWHAHEDTEQAVH
jgi:hypothetical protein